MHYEIYSTLLPTCVADMNVTVMYKYGGSLRIQFSSSLPISFQKYMILH